VDTGVQIYHSLKANGTSYAELEKKYKVLALRVGDVTSPPYRPFSRTERTALTKILKSSTGLQFLTRIASGSFAQVYKVKQVKGMMNQMGMDGNQRLEMTLH